MTQTIAKEATRLERLVNDLLTYARPRPPKRLSINLVDSLHQVLALTRPAADQGGVEIHLEAPDEGIPVHADSDQLQQLFSNLLLNGLRPPGVAPESCWIGEEETILLGPVEDPLPRLARLAEIYWAGLSQPLHFFPEAGFAYAERVQKGQDEERALAAARTLWVGNEFSKKTPEGQDPYHRLVFRNQDPLDADFVRLTREVFLPMLEHRRP